MNGQWVLFCTVAILVLVAASLAMSPGHLEADPAQYSIGRLREATVAPREGIEAAAALGAPAVEGSTVRVDLLMASGS